jgi:hypothetical protein
METYLPGAYGKKPVKPMATARRLFQISLEIGHENPWTDNDHLVIVDSASCVIFDQQISAGKHRPSRRLFELRQFAARTKYRAEIRMQSGVFVLFDYTNLSRMQLDDRPTNTLETPVALFESTSQDQAPV